MLDVVSAWVVVGLILASPWVLVAGLSAAAGAGAVWLVFRRRLAAVRGELADQRTAVADLAVKLADARRRYAQEMAVAYQHRAEQAHARACALGSDVVDLQVTLARVSEGRPPLRLVRPAREAAEDLVAVAAAAGVLVDPAGEGSRP